MTSLGKRKRAKPQDPSFPLQTPETDSSTNEQEAAKRALWKYFEAQFEPLQSGLGHVGDSQRLSESDVDFSSEESEFGGLSDSEDCIGDGNARRDRVQVEVVEHVHISRTDQDELDRAEMRSFMTSKPPSIPKKKGPTSKALAKDPSSSEDAQTEATNLKNDVALQRLLQESHLLDSSLSYNTAKHKRKAIDLRLQSLGSKKSLLAQERMPMSHRKGIVKKKSDTEETRRREAKENGIVLERVKRKVGDAKRRDRGVGAPAVGRFKGGMLSLSRKDVKEIVGPGRR